MEDANHLRLGCESHPVQQSLASALWEPAVSSPCSCIASSGSHLSLQSEGEITDSLLGESSHQADPPQGLLAQGFYLSACASRCAGGGASVKHRKLGVQV